MGPQSNEGPLEAIMIKKLFLISLIAACSAPEPTGLGTSIRNIEGKNQAALSPCPSSPNCYTSTPHSGQNEGHLGSPIPVLGNRAEAKEAMLRYLLNDNATLVKQTENYIHATYTSAVFKFVDDVELFFPNDRLIEFRSASRTGRSDLGVNKKRIEGLRFRYLQRE